MFTSILDSQWENAGVASLLPPLFLIIVFRYDDDEWSSGLENVVCISGELVSVSLGPGRLKSENRRKQLWSLSALNRSEPDWRLEVEWC